MSCFCICLLFAGCLLKRNDYQTPGYPLPDPVQTEALPVPADAQSSVALNLDKWWQQFGSAELDALMQRALADNPDIRIATLHLAQARIHAAQAHGAQYPTLDAELAAGPQHGNAPSATTSGASLSAAYTLDVWGERAALAQEADYQLWQAEFDAENARRTVTASVAATYVDYLAVNGRLKIAQITEQILTGLLDTLQKRTAAGDATLLELEQQRSTLYSERALIPSLELQRSTAVASLSALLGTLPAALQLSGADLDSIHLPGAVPALPAALLTQRADVRSAEMKLLAADVDIDVMRARLLPTFNLSAQAGYSGLLEQLFGPKSFFWNMFGSISANVFDDGKRASDIELARLTHEEMTADYAKTLLQAVREVDGALQAIHAADQRVQLQQEALQSAQRAWDISTKMYLVGGADFMALQDTERTYRRFAEDNQQLRADYYHDYINLFQALGGSAASTTMGNDAGIDWQPYRTARDQPAWQIELDGLYQRQTVPDVLQDLQRKYPKQMDQRKLYPQLRGRIDNLKYGEASWYRLRVAPFPTIEQAQQLCDSIRKNMQRCSVLPVSSDS